MNITDGENTVTEIKDLVAYYRVSTKKQEETRLGLDAQVRDVEYLRSRHSATIIDAQTEIETGSCNTRPKLLAAIAKCRATGATLVVAKLDRLARDVEFVAHLMNSGVHFIACDNPTANELTIHILAAVAQNELKMIRAHTKAGLESARLKGKKLGSARPGHWDGKEHLRGVFSEGMKKSLKDRSADVRRHYSIMLPTIRMMLRNGSTQNEIVKFLNDDGQCTSKKRPFTQSVLQTVIARYLDTKVPA